VTTQQAAPDRRAALKARHRQAILDAADALIRERGNRHFSVDELAARADVARRTVFNHFPSLDDVIMTTCTRVVTAAVDEFRAATAANPAGDGSLASLFEDIVAPVRGMDLPTVVSYLSGVLAEDGDESGQHMALRNVFTRTTDQLSLEIAGRYGGLDEFDVAIMVSSLMNGIAVVSQHWIIRTNAALDDASRAVWDELLERLITTVRSGYPATTT
jgi:AcrR family transcriptional regulator